MTPFALLLRAGLPFLALVLVCAVPTLAQETALPGAGLSGQSLRPYRFVFMAYAVAWLVILGWIVSVGRRMAALDRRLGPEGTSDG